MSWLSEMKGTGGLQFSIYSLYRDKPPLGLFSRCFPRIQRLEEIYDLLPKIWRSPFESNCKGKKEKRRSKKGLLRFDRKSSSFLSLWWGTNDLKFFTRVTRCSLEWIHKSLRPLKRGNLPIQRDLNHCRKDDEVKKVSKREWEDQTSLNE